MIVRGTCIGKHEADWEITCRRTGTDSTKAGSCDLGAELMDGLTRADEDEENHA
jgi:hypothetical protein